MSTQIDLLGNAVPESQKPTLTFKQWQVREGNVLYRCGAQNMSTTHLLAHLLRNQTTAENLLDHFGDLSSVAEASVVELKKVKGVGVAQAESLKVAFELSRRLTETAPSTMPGISSPAEVYRLLHAELSLLQQEVLKALLLNTKNKVTHMQTVFMGSLSASICHPREIFKLAIRMGAASVIVAHNHPSGVRSKGAPNQRLAEKTQAMNSL